jgi:stage II sporulation protein GA (sporulation sigma-E factor processing peptidase)
MKMYLYLDLIWLLNFLIDYLLLWMTGLFRKVEVKKWRLCLASAIGSCYVLFLFLPPLLPFYTFGFKLVLSLIIVTIAFGFGNIQKFALSFLTFYFVSFITGGGMLGVHFFLQTNHQLLQGMVATQSTGYGDRISWGFIAIGFPIMYWFSKSRWKQIEATKVKSDVLTRVFISINEQVIECTGLIDTGNQLYEPFTKIPVMMVEASCFHNILPQTLLEQIKQKKDISSLQLDDDELPARWMNRIRIVPYRGIQQGMEFMIAIKPDQVEIAYEGRRYTSNRVLIGMNAQPLSNDGVFQSIVHPALIQNPLKEEAI